MTEDRKKAAYDKLAEVVDELVDCLDTEDGDGGEGRYLGTAYALVIGGKRYDDEGLSEGCVYVCPANGKQANWETSGLLSEALSSVQRNRE